MNIPIKKIEYLDKEAFRLVGLIEKLEQHKSGVLKGSVKDQIPITLENGFIGGSMTVDETFIDKIVARKYCDKNGCYGFSKTTFSEFEKFINSIIKDRNINKLVSRKFIDNITFDWIIQTYLTGQAKTNFSNYLIDKMNDSIREYKLYYPIEFLNIENPFSIGGTKFEYLTKENFDRFINRFAKNNPSEKEKNPYEELRKKYQGIVLCSCIIKAEKRKAEILALEKCSIAVDILKICSETLEYPFAKLSFDINSRIIENNKSEVLTQEVIKLDEICSNLYLSPRRHMVDKKNWNYYNIKNKLSLFNNYISNLNENLSELDNLIIKAITRFGIALSNHNFHQRIVELFTILESLLLKDQEISIIDSVTKYCSKLIYKKPNDRTRLIKLLKDMYSVRSAAIHHGIDKEFDMDELKALQFAIRDLLLKLIEKSKDHLVKKTILDEIDEAILRA